MSRYVDADKLAEAVSEQKLVSEHPLIKWVLIMIEHTPTANVQEVRYGEWIPNDYEFYHCSECGYEQDSPEYITPYCPNCGAKMDKEEL